MGKTDQIDLFDDDSLPFSEEEVLEIDSIYEQYVDEWVITHSICGNQDDFYMAIEVVSMWNINFVPEKEGGPEYQQALEVMDGIRKKYILFNESETGGIEFDALCTLGCVVYVELIRMTYKASELTNDPYAEPTSEKVIDSFHAINICEKDLLIDPQEGFDVSANAMLVAAMNHEAIINQSVLIRKLIYEDEESDK